MIFSFIPTNKSESSIWSVLRISKQTKFLVLFDFAENKKKLIFGKKIQLNRVVWWALLYIIFLLITFYLVHFPKFLCLLLFKSCNLKKRQPFFQIVTLQEKLTNVREKKSEFVDSCQKKARHLYLNIQISKFVLILKKIRSCTVLVLFTKLD